MAAVNASWAITPVDIIDSLVDLLKRTERWSRDARSLRSLNRHWCATINRHIFEVKPHQSRKLSVEDIRSLLKFQNLTVLDAVPFEGSRHDAEERSLLIADSLRQLRHLNELHVQYALDHWREDNSEFLLSLHSCHFGRVYGMDSRLSKMKNSKVQKLVGYFRTEDLIDYLLLTPSMKILILQGIITELRDHFDPFVRSTERLESMSLCIDWSTMELDIGRLQNLVSLDICGASNGQNLEPLLNLSNLTSLSFTCWNDGIFHDPAFKILMTRLISLKLCCTHFCHLDEDLEDSITLKHLTLGYFVLGRRILDDLGLRLNLSLSFLNCRFDLGIYDRGLPTLKELCFEECGHRHVVLSCTNQLEKLELCLEDMVLDAELLTEIRSLTKLESLTIKGAFKIKQHYSFPWEAFEKLGDLSHLSFLSVSGQVSLQTIEAFLGMEMLTKLEEVSICILGEIHERYVEYRANVLRSKALHLKLNIDYYR